MTVVIGHAVRLRKLSGGDVETRKTHERHSKKDTQLYGIEHAFYKYIN